MLPVAVRDTFIDLLMETGNVSSAARRLGINRMTAYGWRRDPNYADRWETALELARQGIQESVAETAYALGLGRWVPAVDSLTGGPGLDDDFEPLMRFETEAVDVRVLMKLMDKTMQNEVQRVDQYTEIGGFLEHVPREGGNVVFYDVDGHRVDRANGGELVEDAEFEEVEDDPLS